MTRRSVAISLVIVGSLLASCEDSVAPPAESAGPGWLALHLSTPHQGPEALLLRITGGPIDSIVSHDYTLFSNGAVRSDWRALLVGSMTGGVVARIWVPDPSTVGQYSAVIEQAAAREGFEQQAVSGYALTIAATGRY